MTHVIAFQFKWPSILIGLLISLNLSVTQNLNTHSNSSSFNCSKYNNSNLYSGKICGTDGITYANKRYLWCVNFHTGVDVATAHPGHCLPNEKYCQRNYIYSPVCGYDGKTWSNVESLRCHNLIYNTTNVRKFNGTCNDYNTINDDVCSKNGFNNDGVNPVCASNGFTYQNVNQVKCLRKYNNNGLHILYDGNCKVSTIHKILSNINWQIVCNISEMRYEWNPVCATDNNTYANPFLFLCKMKVHNKNLKVAFHGECDSAAHKFCIRAGINSRARITGELIRKINTTKSDEVCGNDGITYKSIDHLYCKASNNKYLNFKHMGRCRGPNDNPCGAVPCDESRVPICASNNVTYVSIEAMWCMNRGNSTADLFHRHDGPCLDTQ